MISESDKFLFRSTIDKKIPIDKDADKEIESNKTNRNRIFDSYSYLSKPNLSGTEPVSYSQSGVSPKTIKKMKQGNLGQPPSIDLHGQVIKEACRSLSNFIHYHQDEKFIHIIHGKGFHSEQGLSILKSQVVHYLKQHPQVLAFYSCPQNSGGTGAVFVNLKN
jgi:DNA-nicking Smr family endonuclease